jgi:Ca2+-binding EF-hand superfamily protein
MKKVCAGLAAAAIAVVIGSAAPAFAATKKPVTSSTSTHEKMVTLKQADKDKDGYISRSEADASPALSRQFSALDKNSDGKLSAAEYSKHK